MVDELTTIKFFAVLLFLLLSSLVLLIGSGFFYTEIENKNME
ncbi:hypothetical protein [Collibacillus ludicampi]|nr:hypothetical protein [Collibacillus ludicampi]